MCVDSDMVDAYFKLLLTSFFNSASFGYPTLNETRFRHYY